MKFARFVRPFLLLAITTVLAQSNPVHARRAELDCRLRTRTGERNALRRARYVVRDCK